MNIKGNIEKEQGDKLQHKKPQRKLLKTKDEMQKSRILVYKDAEGDEAAAGHCKVKELI